MSRREDLLAAAVSQLGYGEGPQNDTIYGRWYGMNNNPWCMMFVSWCAAQAGISTDIIPKMAYCPYAVAWFQARGQFLPLAGTQAQAGDLIFFGGNGGGAAHVGLVERVEAGRLHTIEGNREDRVDRYSYAVDDSRLLGLARPAWGEEEEACSLPAPEDIPIYLADGPGRVPVKGWVSRGVTYIRLRDVERLFPVRVGWDEKQRVATLALNYCEAGR